MKKELDLTLLVDYHINDSAKAYLQMMYENGYFPKKIIVIGVLQGKLVKKLSRYIGKIYAFKLIKFILKFIHQKPLKEKKELANIITRAIGSEIDFFNKIKLDKFTKDIEYIYTQSYKDEKFLNYIKKQNTKTFLYGASGIIPKEFLDLEGVKVLHIHPGIVPDVKGSDGFFWSIALRNRLGYSCFYMDPGIDTGDIIQTQEYEIPDIKIPNTYNSDTVYHVILNYCDTVYRAKLLINILDNHFNSLASIKTKKQNAEDGDTYFTMHKKLINKIIKKYFQ